MPVEPGLLNAVRRGQRNQFRPADANAISKPPFPPFMAVMGVFRVVSGRAVGARPRFYSSRVGVCLGRAAVVDGRCMMFADRCVEDSRRRLQQRSVSDGLQGGGGAAVFDVGDREQISRSYKRHNTGVQ